MVVELKDAYPKCVVSLLIFILLRLPVAGTPNPWFQRKDGILRLDVLVNSVPDVL